ncbi:MAG: Polynucleotide adenylyltransferase [Candidatus Sulfotelmatobacter sp.]|nr:Polynucleotide adenylyltransferase [Candidatus Sulfotelmatobacter sp.]
MADYIYTMEIRLTPDQMKGVNLVQDVARAAGITLYLTGGAIRDIISGFTIRDLDFTVQGNPLKLQKDFERAGARLAGHDEDVRTLFLVLPGNVRAEIGMARTEIHEKVGKPPAIAPASIQEDLRRRDFTVNAMALSLNEGSRGLLLDPFNGVADIEAKLLRILHNYSFVEDPSRLIRATRFAARFHWPMEERTQQRYDAAKENKYIDHISRGAIGHEIGQIAHEDDPLNVIRALEREDWMKVLHPHWSSAKVDTNGLALLMKTRQQMVDLGYTVDPSAAVMHFLTARLSEKDISDLRRQIPRKDLIEAWRDIEDHAKDLAKRLTGKEAATPSRTWNLLSSARPEMILFLAVTSRNQTVAQKIKNFLTKWRQVQQRLPLPEMTELLITSQLPEYPKIARDVFMLLLDGKLRSRTETLKFLKPFAPPPPPPPPPPRRGRGPKAAAGAPTPVVAGKKGEAPKGKGKVAAAVAPPLAPVAAPVKQATAANPKSKAKPESKAKPSKAPPAKPRPKPAAKRPAKKAGPKKAKSKKR